MPTEREAITPEQLKEWADPKAHDGGDSCFDDPCEQIQMLAQALLREQELGRNARVAIDVQAARLAAAQREIERLRKCLKTARSLVNASEGQLRCGLERIGDPEAYYGRALSFVREALAALAAESEGAK